MVLKSGTGPPSAADVRFGEQVSRTYTRDSQGNIVSVTISSTNPSSTSTFTYNRDSKGRVSTVVATGDFSRTTTITRDANGRVTSVSTV